MTTEISLSEDLIDMKAPHNHRVSVLIPYLFVLVCLLIELRYNLKVGRLYFFFQNWGFQIGGGAYLRVQLIHGFYTGFTVD